METLAQAERLLHGHGVVPHQALRAACWLVRCALEKACAVLLDARGVAVGMATFKSTLLCVHVLYADQAPELPAQVESAWERLSRAVHHHAFDLSPTLGEVRDLIHIVRGIAEFADNPPGR